MNEMMDSIPRKIAVIVSGIDEEYQREILQGIHDYAKQNNVHVMHFVAFGGTLRSKSHDTGEYNIYQLCQFEAFDGVILLTNTISESVVTAKIIKTLSSCRVPVVCVDNDVDARFYYIGINNLNAMRNIVEHFIYFHHCKRIAYISGPEGNPESIQRYHAYESAMRKAGLEIDKNLIYYGSFRSVDGRDGVEYFLDNNDTLPEVIICANDVMALATILELTDRGIRVPEDVMVSGFDNTYAARNFSPAVTSVRRPLYESGFMACQKVLESNFESARSVVLDTKPVFRASCGCACKKEDDDHLDNDLYRKDTFTQLEYYRVNVPSTTRMSYVLAENEKLDSSIAALKDFVIELGCDRFYLCLGTDWNAQGIQKDDRGRHLRFIDHFTTVGYTPTMRVPLALTDDGFTTLPDFPSKQMLPDIELDYPKHTMYYFLPLHFRNRCFGYVLLCGNHFNAENPLMHNWVMNIANALENIRKMQHLNKALAEVRELYLTDPLCKINNRNGFDTFTSDPFASCQKDHRKCMIMFIDMDHLKYINDNFSHEEGDNAIHQLAKAIKLSCDEGEVCARYGGDEFVIFGADYNDDMAQRLANKIRKRADDYNSVSAKPYEVGASIGWYVTQVVEGDDLGQLITAADQRMYSEKKRRRMVRPSEKVAHPGRQDKQIPPAEA